MSDILEFSAVELARDHRHPPPVGGGTDGGDARPHRGAEPAPQRHRRPAPARGADGGGARRRRRRRQRPPARSAAGGEGSRRRRGPADPQGLGGDEPGAGRRRQPDGLASARGGRDLHRQDQCAGIRARLLFPQPHLWNHPQRL